MSKTPLELIEGHDQASLEAAAWFARLRADDASGHDRQQWQRWMDQSPANRQAYARLESIWSAMGGHAHTPEVAIQVRRALARRAPDQRRNPAALLAVAASLALAAILGIKWLLPPASVPATVYATATGERRLVRLEDGTRVDLDSGASLRVQMGRQERLLTLERGRAFFRVAREARPLRVEAGTGSVLAVGTQFEIDRHADAIDVALFEGKVNLMSSAPSLDRAVQLGSLTAGQSARVAGRAVTPAGPVQAGGTPGWLSGRLSFDDQPLSAAIAEFNRYSPQPLRLESSRLGQQRVSGSFRSDDATAFIEALDAAYGIGHRREPDGSTLLTEPH